MLKTVILLFIPAVFFCPCVDRLHAEAKKCPICPDNNETTYKFALLNEKDELVRFSELIKKSNIIVAFWATYCLPCKREIPQLIELEKKYGKAKNLKLVLINTDKEGKGKAMPVLKEMNVPGESLFDIYQIALQKYSTELKIPATFLINKNGEILFKAVGESEENINSLEKAIKEMQ